MAKHKQIRPWPDAGPDRTGGCEVSSARAAYLLSDRRGKGTIPIVPSIG